MPVLSAAPSSPAPTATELLAALRSGELSAEALAQRSLQRIAERDSDIRAWVTVRPELVLAQARAAGGHQGRGRHYYSDSTLIIGDEELPPDYTMGDFTPSTVHGCRMPHAAQQHARGVAWRGDALPLRCDDLVQRLRGAPAETGRRKV